VRYADAPSELLWVAEATTTALSGAVVENGIHWSAAENLTVLNYADAPTDLLWHGDGSTRPLSHRLSLIAWSPDGRFAVANYENGLSDLIWHDNGQVRLLNLGAGLASADFDVASERLLLHYTRGDSVLLNLAWFRAFDFHPEQITADELFQILCTGPLASPLLATTATEFRDLLGNRPPLVCQPSPAD
jgi:hypothetical protein